MADRVPAREFENVPCPFCGLLCDDLRLSTRTGSIKVIANGCARSRRLFSADAGTGCGCIIDGRAASFDEALARTADILRQARRPLMLSAGTDVAGMRSLLEFAELSGGIVDHANHETMFRNLRVLQDTGWISTTLTELRNRADLLVIAGNEIGSRFPRFFERCFGPFETLFDTGARDLIFIGSLPDDLPAEVKTRATVFPLDPARLAEVFAFLRALLAGRPMRAADVAGLSLEKLSALLARMRNAKYGVISWTAAEFNFAHADLAIQAICDLVRDLNRATRFTVLPLGGSDGDTTAQQVTTWQTGFSVGVDFSAGAPAQVSSGAQTTTLLGSGEVDALLFVSAFDHERTTPTTRVPTIVLGRAGMQPGNCAVFIPIGVPGLHHAGHLYRTDNVVAMRMRQIAEGAYPSAAQVLQKLINARREAK
jgi:formylmethanofuran dehydrogenase subunit B